jgi:hypothetical protein
VRGSLITGTDQVTLIATGDILDAGDYTLTLRSGAMSFVTLGGDLLDGNDDGTPGDDFVHTFTVATSDARGVSLGDFARVPGQSVDFPVSGKNFGIIIDDLSGVEGIDLTTEYDPTLLTITGATRGADAPNDAGVLLNSATPGVAKLVISLATVASGTNGPLELVRLIATVPDGALYGAKHALDITSLRINEGAIASVGEDTVHVVAYLGDTTGNGDYSSSDGQRILRLAVDSDGGLGAYPLADPTIIADLTGNDTISSLDATKVLREALDIPESQIPRLPDPLPTIVLAGLDPTVSAPQDLRAAPGQVVSVPVRVDTIPAGLDSVRLRLHYDPATVEVLSVSAGWVTADFTVFAVNSDTLGVVTLDASNGALMEALEGGTLANLTLRIRDDAVGGTSLLDIQNVRLNDGRYTLIPLLVPGLDGSDGSWLVAWLGYGVVDASLDAAIEPKTKHQ